MGMMDVNLALCGLLLNNASPELICKKHRFHWDKLWLRWMRSGFKDGKA